MIGVSYTGVEGYTTLDDLFDPEVNRKAITRALNRAKSNGVKVKALLISKSVADPTFLCEQEGERIFTGP